MTDAEVVPHVVVGSGPAGTIAAQRLLELGQRVLLVDVGDDDPQLRNLVPDRPFEDLRRTDPRQAAYFLGPNEEGIPHGRVQVGAHLTPPRQFVRRGADERLETETPDASVMQSLALGGLGAAWGAGIATYTDAELRAIGLEPARVDPQYAQVAARIGVSGEACGLIAKLDPSQAAGAVGAALPVDENAERVLRRFRKIGARLGAPDEQLDLGPHPLAALSESRADRQANPLHDMDFYSDSRRSVFRPRYLLEDLARQPGFTLRRSTLVLGLERRAGGGADIRCRDLGTGELRTIRAHTVILAAGAINTARILMNSPGAGEAGGVGQPLLANPYRYWVMLNLPRLGQRSVRPRHSLAQLYGLYRRRGEELSDVALAFYSYRSLLLFKLVREFPMPAAFGRVLARLLVDSLVIVGVHERGTEGRIRLVQARADGPASIRIEAPPGEPAENPLDRGLLASLRRLGLVRLAALDPGWGSSIHYAGTVPRSSSRSAAIRAGEDFEVRGWPRVFLADSSAWNDLPAKGLTLTIMAQARALMERVVATSPAGARA